MQLEFVNKYSEDGWLPRKSHLREHKPREQDTLQSEVIAESGTRSTKPEFLYRRKEKDVIVYKGTRDARELKRAR